MAQNALFRKARVRKAKHGFFSKITADNFVALAEAKLRVELYDQDVIIEIDFNMGAHDIKIYTDNDQTAEWFEGTFC